MRTFKKAAAAFCSAVMMGMYALPASAEDNSNAAASQTAVSCVHEATMYKGESRVLDFTRSKGKAMPTVSSSDSSVISVSGRKLTAVKSGTADIKVVTEGADGRFDVTTMHISVKISSYGKSVDYKTGSLASGDRSGLVFHKQLAAGETYKPEIKGEKLTFTSSDSKIAAVSESGEIKAVADGEASIEVLENGKCVQTVALSVTAKGAGTALTQEQINEFFSKSGFIGTSIGEGQKYYFQSKGSGYLGDPVMMVKGCYGLYNDEGRRGDEYQISYNGVKAPARICVKNSGVESVFINVGTNDMYGRYDEVFEMYKKYLEGIRQENPNVLMFVEAMTPIFAEGQRGNLTNENVDGLNRMLAEYCEGQADMYFIDVATPLKNPQGALAEDYSSDHYVHLTFPAYEVWTNTLISYVSDLMTKNADARDAVETYVDTGSDEDKKLASELVAKLPLGKLRTELEGKIK